MLRHRSLAGAADQLHVRHVAHLPHVLHVDDVCRRHAGVQVRRRIRHERHVRLSAGRNAPVSSVQRQQLLLHALGVRRLHVRVDRGDGVGPGVRTEAAAVDAAVRTDDRWHSRSLDQRSTIRSVRPASRLPPRDGAFGRLLLLCRPGERLRQLRCDTSLYWARHRYYDSQSVRVGDRNKRKQTPSRFIDSDVRTNLVRNHAGGASFVLHPHPLAAAAGLRRAQSAVPAELLADARVAALAGGEGPISGGAEDTAAGSALEPSSDAAR